MANILWRPDPASVEKTQLTAFISELNRTYGQNLKTWQDLHKFSVTEIDLFWSAFARFSGIKFSNSFKNAFSPGSPCPFRNSIWFEGATLNYAENLLESGDGQDIVLASFTENNKKEISRTELKNKVHSVAQYLLAQGIESGDRVAAVSANNEQALICFLAASSIGAVWSSSSPDFGVDGILDRFSQISPKILFATDSYHYNGKLYDCREKIKQVQKSLPTLRRTIWLGDSPKGEVSFREVADSSPSGVLNYRQLPFDHPLYILFSSGTTGSPKCIVHRAGGAIIQHLKEHQLHLDNSRKDNVFYHTTCGWMMWNWLVSALATGAKINLFDGSPVYPEAGSLFQLADKEEWSVFGTSASFLLAAEKNKVNCLGKLSKLRLLLSTGSPLLPEQYDYIYQNIKQDLCLSSISGGTDIVSCFALGAVTEPVRKGEIQVKGLGMDVDCFSDQGESLTNKKGELVCKSPFPVVPLQFWNDHNQNRFSASYFERFPGVWHHGDWLEINEDGGLMIYGRSDATLNPGGVRIGTAEIYRIVDSFPEVLESVAVGQKFQGSERVLLFVLLSSGETEISPELSKIIKDQIRKKASPRHVPAAILAAPAIPRTRSGKAVEIAVRRCINGEEVDNLNALANPEALEYFRNLRDLDS